MIPDSVQLDALLRTSFFPFTWHVFNLLHPGETFIPSPYLRVMADALERSFRGEIPRLLITVPPRHGKSIMMSVAAPAFWLGQDASLKVMVASYGAELASKHARDFRAVVRTTEYQRLFPEVVVDRARDTELEVMTTQQRGFRRGVSLGGAVTGLGADLLIIDDLMKAADAQSQPERQRAKEFYEQTLFSRLNNKSNARIISIQQRLHEDDHAAYLLDKGFTHLNLKAIAEEDEVHRLSSGAVWRRNRGDALFPEREPVATLEQIRREIGPYAFAAQYQQNPIAPEGNLLRWERFGTYDEVPHRSELLNVVQSWDTAHSAEPTADCSVCMTFGLRQDGVWLLVDVWRQQVEYPALRQQVRLQQQRWRADTVLIERAGAGYPLLSELYQDLQWRSRLVPYQPRVEKVVRFAAQTAKIEDGVVLRPGDASWLEGLRRELMAFPNGRHDDQADALTQFLDWVGTRHGVSRTQHGGALVRRDIPRRNTVGRR